MASTNIRQFSQLDAGFKGVDIEALIALIWSGFPLGQYIPFSASIKALNHKHLWYDQVYSRESTTLTGNISSHLASATGITINVADSSIATTGDRVTVDGLDPVYEITAVPGGTSFTVKEVAGIALSVGAGSGSRLVATRGEIEQTEYGTFKGADLATQYHNFTQIFRRDISVSRHAIKEAQAGQVYSVQDLFGQASAQQAKQLAAQLYTASLRGVKQERTSDAIKGYMGGVRSFVDIAGGNVLSSSGALTMAKLNTVAGYIYDDMNMLSDLIIVMHPSQNKVMSTFDSNLFHYNDPGINRAVGTNANQYVADIAGSQPINIVIDPQLDPSIVLFLDPSKMYLIPFQDENFRIIEENTPGVTAERAYIYGEYTLVVRNGQQAHGIIKGLDYTL